MIMGYASPFDTLFAFQRALEDRFSSDWLGDTTAGTGTYPPINVFQQGDDLVAIMNQITKAQPLTDHKQKPKRT